MQTIEFEYGGKVLHLYMNGEAMFAIEALNEGKPEDAPEVLDLIIQNTPEGVDALCRVPEEQELKLLLNPVQLVALRVAVYRAVNAGFGTASEESNCDIDTGLAELEKKTRF